MRRLFRQLFRAERWLRENGPMFVVVPCFLAMFAWKGWREKKGEHDAK